MTIESKTDYQGTKINKNSKKSIKKIKIFCNILIINILQNLKN